MGNNKQFPYRSIEEVDFEDGCVSIKADGETCEIFLGNRAEDENYPRYMYGFIMDILDYLRENEEMEERE